MPKIARMLCNTVKAMAPKSVNSLTQTMHFTEPTRLRTIAPKLFRFVHKQPAGHFVMNHVVMKKFFVKIDAFCRLKMLRIAVLEECAAIQIQTATIILEKPVRMKKYAGKAAVYVPETRIFCAMANVLIHIMI